MRRVLYHEEKLTPQSSPLPFSSISSTCLFLFSQAFASLPLQTRKQSLKDYHMPPMNGTYSQMYLLLGFTSIF